MRWDGKRGRLLGRQVYLCPQHWSACRPMGWHRQFKRSRRRHSRLGTTAPGPEASLLASTSDHVTCAQKEARVLPGGPTPSHLYSPINQNRPLTAESLPPGTSAALTNLFQMLKWTLNTAEAVSVLKEIPKSFVPDTLIVEAWATGLQSGILAWHRHIGNYELFATVRCSFMKNQNQISLRSKQ